MVHASGSMASPPEVTARAVDRLPGGKVVDVSCGVEIRMLASWRCRSYGRSVVSLWMKSCRRRARRARSPPIWLMVRDA
jgi:hypothetical protein